MKGVIKAPVTAQSIGALSNQGGCVATTYNPINGDAGIGRGTGTQISLVFSDNGYLYRMLNGVPCVLYDEGYKPWGGEAITTITQEQMADCTSIELGNCVAMSRCGFALASLSGIVLEAGVTGHIALPYPARYRCQVRMADLTNPANGTLAYIDAGSSTVTLFPPATRVASGYCTLIYPINV